MADDVKTTPTWGYGKKDAKIFDLKDGESLPKGYYDSPVAMEEAETKPKATVPPPGYDAPKEEPKPDAAT